MGCGDRYAEGWLNVDHSAMPHRKDLALDIRGELPWEPRTLDFVYLGHVLEHLRVGECLSLLERLRWLVAPAGEIMIVGPDCDVARGMQVAGTLDVTLESLVCGADRWEGDVHRWECSGHSIRTMLVHTGWPSVTQLSINDVPEIWPVADRRPQWQCAVSARVFRME